jgi:hypothetical protein
VFPVDGLLAAATAIATVVLPGPNPNGAAVVVGLLLTVPLAWRRRAPMATAGVVLAAGCSSCCATRDA